MAMLLSREADFQHIDMNRVIRMCLIHDLGEAFTGDIPTFQKSENDAEIEDIFLEDWVNSFSKGQRDEWTDLLS